MSESVDTWPMWWKCEAKHGPGIQSCPHCPIGSAPKPEPPKDEQERIYPCDNCDKMRTEDEGGTVFTVCETCWDEMYPKDDPIPEPPKDVASEPCQHEPWDPQNRDGSIKTCQKCGEAVASEPDFEMAQCWAQDAVPSDPSDVRNAARAYLALRYENAALKAEVERLKAERHELRHAIEACMDSLYAEMGGMLQYAKTDASKAYQAGCAVLGPKMPKEEREKN